MIDKKEFSSIIQSNIDKYGYHVTVVNSSIEPRYAYTIGLTDMFGFEFIFAGGIYYMKDQLLSIFDAIVREFKNKDIKSNDSKIAVETLGTFSFSEVKSSWAELMMLGVFDYYKQKEIKAFQILPDQQHHTLDIPDMGREFNVSTEPVWRWLIDEWPYEVPYDSSVVTNMKALQGEVITEVMRWEQKEWEMFSGPGPDVPKEDMRVVSLGTLLGIDKSLMSAMDLEIGKGLWRDPNDLVWNAWVLSSSSE